MEPVTVTEVFGGQGAKYNEKICITWYLIINFYLGSQLSTAILVSSGILVGFLTHPSLLEIL